MRTAEERSLPLRCAYIMAWSDMTVGWYVAAGEGQDTVPMSGPYNSRAEADHALAYAQRRLSE